MSVLSLIKPVIGRPDATEDQKLVNALTAIESWANGASIEAANLAAEAVGTAALEKEGVTEAKLSAALVKRLGEAVTVGAWQKLTMGPKMEAAGGIGVEPRSRAELGLNTARWEGLIKVRAGDEIEPSGLVFFLPAGLRPNEVLTVSLSRKDKENETRTLVVDESGEVSLTTGKMVAGSIWTLTGLTIPLT